MITAMDTMLVATNVVNHYSLFLPLGQAENFIWLEFNAVIEKYGIPLVDI